MSRLRVIDDEAIERPFNKNQFKRIISYLLPYKKKLVITLFLVVLSSLCSLMLPKLMSAAIDQLNEENFSLLAYMLLGMLLVSAVSAVCMRYRRRIMDRVGRSAIASLREDLFNHIQDLPMSFFDTRSAGKIMVRVINDVNRLNNLLTNGLVDIFIDFLMLILLLILMLTVNVTLTLISLSILPILVFLAFIVRRKIRRNWQVVRAKTSNMNGYLHESLSGMRITQAFTREEENNSIFDDTNEDIRKTWMHAILLNNAFWPVLDTVSTVGTILVYYFGVHMIIGDSFIHAPLTIGSMLLITWYLGRFWQPLNNMSNFYNSILVASASIERICEILDTPIDIRSKEGAPELPPIQGNIDFDHVTFSYNTDKVVLHDVSFHVDQGQTIALVGPTGAGKSTIVNLLSRFYDTTEGAVKIDGYDIKDVDLYSLRKQMGVMMQDSFIFSGTVMDNIRYGRLDATDEEVMEAAKAVRVHDFIMSMENGYDTEVNERGSRLSVGEKQLISFARALLNDPKILILDEATSSIDTHTEMLIQQALEVLLKGRTSFVIAHRLSTIRKADNIMVVQDGKIAESGTHRELLDKRGIYYELTQAQYKFLDSTPQ